MAKKNKITMKLMRGNGVSKTVMPDQKKIDKMIKLGQEKHQLKDPVYLINRNDHSVDVAYGEDQKIRLSPKSRNTKVADGSLLGELPKGVMKKKVVKKNTSTSKKTKK